MPSRPCAPSTPRKLVSNCDPPTPESDSVSTASRSESLIDGVRKNCANDRSESIISSKPRRSAIIAPAWFDSFASSSNDFAYATAVAECPVCVAIRHLRFAICDWRLKRVKDLLFNRKSQIANRQSLVLPDRPNLFQTAADEVPL